jgi:hypothetical protein
MPTIPVPLLDFANARGSPTGSHITEEGRGHKKSDHAPDQFNAEGRSAPQARWRAGRR